MKAAPDIRDPETLRRITALADEATDHLLDALEPERSKVMTTVAGIRAAIRKVAERG